MQLLAMGVLFADAGCSGSNMQLFGAVAGKGLGGDNFYGSLGPCSPEKKSVALNPGRSLRAVLRSPQAVATNAAFGDVDMKAVRTLGESPEFVTSCGKVSVALRLQQTCSIA